MTRRFQGIGCASRSIGRAEMAQLQAGIRLSLVPLRIHARTGSSGLSAPFCPLAFLLSPDQSGRWLVWAVGIELKATLEAHKLLIPLNEKNAKKTGFAQVRYTAGTRVFETEFCRFLH